MAKQNLDKLIDLHLFDGTFELCRAYFGARSYQSKKGKEIAAVRSLVRHFYKFLTTSENPHIASAFDHVIESFRNDLFEDYKTGEGMDPDLVEQFPIAEEIFVALGIPLWSMVEFEADDALATAARKFSKSKKVGKIFLCSPDKDLAQCVDDDRVILWDRVREKKYDAKAVREKFGVGPDSIADFLALTGDAADGVPGVPKWGAKSAATLLSEYKKLEKIPLDQNQWTMKVRGAQSLSATLRENFEDAKLYKTLTTLRTDVPLTEKLADLKWQGLNAKRLKRICQELELEDFFQKIPQKWFVQ